MRGKLEVHYDFVAMVVISLALSVGFNLYQRYQYNDLLTQHTALEWEAQDMEINQQLNLRKLESCNNLKHASLPGDQSQAAPASRSPLPLNR